MLKKLLPILAAGVVLSGCIGLDEAFAVRWEILASPVIVVQDEPHVIALPRVVHYRALQLQVVGAPVIVYRVVIEYADGTREVRDVDWAFSSAHEAENLQMSDDRRAVRNITVYTRPEGTRTARATIRVRGLAEGEG